MPLGTYVAKNGTIDLYSCRCADGYSGMNDPSGKPANMTCIHCPSSSWSTYSEDVEHQTCFKLQCANYGSNFVDDPSFDGTTDSKPDCVCNQGYTGNATVSNEGALVGCEPCPKFFTTARAGNDQRCRLMVCNDTAGYVSSPDDDACACDVQNGFTGAADVTEEPRV